MPDASGSEMSTSMNSDASYDIDIVRHHDGGCLVIITSGLENVLFSVATSTANLLDASDTDSESESEEEISRYGKQKNVRQIFFTEFDAGDKNKHLCSFNNDA